MRTRWLPPSRAWTGTCFAEEKAFDPKGGSLREKWSPGGGEVYKGEEEAGLYLEPPPLLFRRTDLTGRYWSTSSRVS